MYRQKHRQLGSGSASTQREREIGERQKCAIFLGEREVRWQCTFRCVCVCVCANKCRFFSFLKKYFEQIKFCFVPREFLYYLTSAIRFTKLGQISARIPLSLFLVRALSLSLLCSRISYFTWSWGLRFRGYYGLCFAQLFRAPISIGYAHQQQQKGNPALTLTTTATPTATRRWGVALSSTQN